MAWSDDTYRCSRCGETHRGLPMSYGASAPTLWFAISADERAARTRLSSDQCVVDDRYFFLLGAIQLKVTDSDEEFLWLAWVSLSEANFFRAADIWDIPGRESEPLYFGWLASELPGYPSTLNLKTEVYTRAVGERPVIILEPTDHPLALEQRDGITLARVQEIAELVLHGAPEE